MHFMKKYGYGLNSRIEVQISCIKHFRFVVWSALVLLLAACGGGDSGNSGQAPSTEIPANSSAPSTPVNFTAVPGNAQVALSWNSVAGATGYNVYRNSTLIASPTSVGYTDTGLTNGVTYTYQVSATNNVGESARLSVNTVPLVPLSPYDTTILADQPVAYWTMSDPPSGTETDRTGHGHLGKYIAFPGTSVLPNGDSVSTFNGSSQYLEVADADDLSIPYSGILTIEAWMRPDVTTFLHEEGTGYVHWMGKGSTGNQEYLARMYGQDNTEGRVNRISGYAFNLDGGLGAGSYFQDPVTIGEWIYYVLVINTRATSVNYPHGYTKIYKNGVLRDQDDLSINNVVIIPVAGSAPFRVGTRDLVSFFQGAIGKVAIYGTELPANTILAHYNKMTH